MGWRAILLAGMLAWAASAASAGEPVQDPRVQVAADPAVISDFELTDQEGRPFHFTQLRGREALFFFGFTHCPNICPTTMLEMKLVSEALETSGQEVPAAVLVSVDGERDTPEVLKKYLAGYPESFIGLTGSPKAIRGIAAQFKAVFFKGLPYDNAGSYQVEHTSMIYLVDASGRLRATFLNAPVASMAEAVRQVSAESR